MRKITFLAAVAATLCTVACNKNMDAQINEVPNPANEERFELRLLPLGAARRFWQLEARGGAPRTLGGFKALLDAQAEQDAQEGQGAG